MRSAAHPRTRDRLRWLLVKFGIPGLTAIFIAALALASALLALALSFDSSSPGSFPQLWRDEAMALVGLTVKAPPANTGSGFRQAVESVQGLLALVLPALYIGAVVFRLFIHPRVFVFRRKLALIPTPETFRGELADGHVLAVRVYNASRMRALEVRFAAVHQHWFGDGTDAVVRNIPVEIANPAWPMADCHVPYTFFVPLAPGDAVEREGRTTLAKLDGRPVGPRDRLVVHVSGTMPDVADDFVERHAFDLAEAVSDEHYRLVYLRYGTDSKSWGGWDGFDD